VSLTPKSHLPKGKGPKWAVLVSAAVQTHLSYAIDCNQGETTRLSNSIGLHASLYDASIAIPPWRQAIK
jgi:hypothetical protein